MLQRFDIVELNFVRVVKSEDLKTQKFIMDIDGYSKLTKLTCKSPDFIGLNR